MLSLIVGAALAGTTPHPYCNVKMDTGVIPPLAQGTATSLVQVQVLIRHGSRTSSHATPGCWAGDSTAEYDCTDATLLEAPDANLPDGNTYYRKIYSRGRNRLRGSCALGQLVAEGLEMCRASGRHLREAYGSFLPPRVAGHESDFYLRSDDSPRTIASGQALFAALYSHSGPSETLLVPWHTMDEDGDAETMMPSAKVCPPLAKAAARAEAAMRSSPHYANVSVPLAAELSTALNRTIKPSKIGALLDCLMSKLPRRASNRAPVESRRRALGSHQISRCLRNRILRQVSSARRCHRLEACRPTPSRLRCSAAPSPRRPTHSMPS